MRYFTVRLGNGKLYDVGCKPLFKIFGYDLAILKVKRVCDDRIEKESISPALGGDNHPKGQDQ